MPIEVQRIEIDIHKLEQFARKLGSSTDAAVRSIAFQTEGEAKAYAPYDTGALQNSINVQKAKEGEYTVGDGVEYGVYQELGTRRMAAHPFLIPGLKNAINKMYAAIEREFNKFI